VEKKCGFGRHSDTTVPLVRRRSLAIAQMEPMKLEAEDQRMG